MSEVIQSTTQQFLDIFDITNNYVIMKDGTASVILTVDAMNFGLLAEEEQDAIMYAYAGLLNSLNYPIQILVQSRTKDVTAYLKLLQEQEVSTDNQTMQHRIRMYREFVSNLIHERNVLDKKFYVVIPATAIEMGIASVKGLLPGQAQVDLSALERSVLLEKAQNLLDPKRDHLIAQFARIGLYSRQLNTQEIIQLFYVRYNPEAAEGQQIGESSSYTTPLVKASMQGAAIAAITQASQQQLAPTFQVPEQPDAVEQQPTFESTPQPETTIIDAPPPQEYYPEAQQPEFEQPQYAPVPEPPEQPLQEVVPIQTGVEQQFSQSLDEQAAPALPPLPEIK